MFCKVLSGIVYGGVSGVLIHVEVDIRNGLPYFTMVGHLSRESKEAKERVSSALRSIDAPLPPQKITVNLSPANLKKSGTAFDFPIAVALMNCLQMIPARVDLSNICILGELGLDGSIHSALQSLPIVLEAKKQGIRTFLVSMEDYNMLRDVEGIQLCPMTSLKDVVEYFETGRVCLPTESCLNENMKELRSLDFSEVRGQAFLKRALEIAVTARLNILIIGSPGSGKTMLCQRIPSILPPLTKEEQLEVNSIYCASSIYRQGATYQPPFRAPHHTITPSGLIGGGAIPKVGELSLAHLGILYLDEFAEFKSECLEALRIPLEHKSITLSRLGRQYKFPTNIQLIATMNPCPCGEGFSNEKCRCSPSQKQRYYKKLSGPIIDRFDMIIPIMSNDYDTSYGETSKVIKKRVEENSLFYKQHASFISISKEAHSLLEEQLEQKSLSMRGHEKILNLAKVLALMEQKEVVEVGHVIEAMAYRNLDFLKEVMLYD